MKIPVILLTTTFSYQNLLRIILKEQRSLILAILTTQLATITASFASVSKSIDI
ncbi:hypothetical protein NIES4075_16690 [Tolypothrix sp. NIES-4075]|uniref:hypothetical protein n=1 Tax=Tolypothrix sp. NIES-4075 TaxID=2005459 RepID=UPI000B700A7D|nr:hypothetical protein [Tolypothrix sp. NIES-4075]GAX40703.1 hypothetical protein NIES4075_16690 [Tolypothrix sp. NIES-4075]